MKRRLLAFVLAVFIIVSISASVSADNSGICFTAVNDKLCELGFMTVYVGGTAYVPGSVFSTYAVYLHYFEATSTAMLYNSNRQIFFDLITGNSDDSNGTYYSVSAIFKNGQVYVPVVWVCDYFGLSCSFINGTGYGDIVRIKNGGEVLTDPQFLDAAASLMRSRYNEYFGTAAAVPVSPAPTVLPQPTEESPTDQPNVSICFIGLPSTKILDSLDNYSVNVCFFVTAKEAEDSPDIIRRIYGSGHSIGVYCTSAPESEYSAAAEAIFTAAQIRPILVTSPESISNKCTEYANENGFDYYKQGTLFPNNVKYASSVTSKIEASKGYVSLSLATGENMDKNLPYILQYIASKHISVLPIRETYT
ncbi:MAG: polysaccharide deacetylase family protein [Clostridiales bacterium]|jgi:hypothetical protein|nr:polysaccharide deacetylase family protein [Clostridiales bacterium]